MKSSGLELTHTWPQVAGTAGAIRLEDFVIPCVEESCSFQQRDANFLNALATTVTTQSIEHTVRP